MCIICFLKCLKHFLNLPSNKQACFTSEITPTDRTLVDKRQKDGSNGDPFWGGGEALEMETCKGTDSFLANFISFKGVIRVL